MGRPNATIVIANHNYGEWVEGAINSALNQTYPCNVIVVDDNSTDNSKQKIHNCLFKGYPHEKSSNDSGAEIKFRTNIISEGVSVAYLSLYLPQCVGPSEARNNAIQATIDWTDAYCILDADDEYYPTKVERLISKWYPLQNAIGVVYADYDILNTETRNIVREYKEPYDFTRLMVECIIHSGALISKEALLKTADQFGFYDRNMRTCEDYDLWMRIAEYFQVVHVPESLSLVRVTPKNSTNTVDSQVWEQNWRRIVEKAHGRKTQQVHGSN